MLVASMATAQETHRVSVNSEGQQANASSSAERVSGGGRLAAFHSSATNLSNEDVGDFDDVFVHDLETGVTELISKHPLAGAGDHASLTPEISADGNLVAFISLATNLVHGDTNDALDIFVKDLQTGFLELASVGFDGSPADGGSSRPSFSFDGRYLAFDSVATNLVSGDGNGDEDCFVLDRDTGQTIRVSEAHGGGDGDSVSRRPRISADGGFVAYRSFASNLVLGDTNGKWDVFVTEIATGLTERVSVSSTGEEGNEHSGNIGHAISADGRYVAFVSFATNLVPGDTNGLGDVFLHDRLTGDTTRINLTPEGAESDGFSERVWISGDGRRILFDSNATDLTPEDLNGATHDVFLRDLDRGRTLLVSRSTDGASGNSISLMAQLSHDGEAATFYSIASNLVPDDTNFADVFVAGPFSEPAIASGKPDSLSHVLSWSEIPAENARFNIYRGSLIEIGSGLYDHAPILGGCGLEASTIEIGDLHDGMDSYYLVTLVNVVGEGPYGFPTNGIRRPRAALACP
jgi:Tol biopolymer transport system component